MFKTGVARTLGAIGCATVALFVVQDMRESTGIDLENIVYYKDDTHYFVMTAKKQSLLDRGVIIDVSALNLFLSVTTPLAPQAAKRGCGFNCGKAELATQSIVVGRQTEGQGQTKLCSTLLRDGSNDKVALAAAPPSVPLEKGSLFTGVAFVQDCGKFESSG